MISTVLKVAGEVAMDFDSNAEMEWHAGHETGGFKAMLRKPAKDSAILCGGRITFVLLLLLAILWAGGAFDRKERGAGAGPGAVFENHTVTVESANTLNECLSSPCKNGATCTESSCKPSIFPKGTKCEPEKKGLPPTDSYRCACAAGFANGMCSQNMNWSLHLHLLWQIKI